MTERSEQHQRSGDESVNLQAGHDIVVHQGVTIEDVRSIAELTVQASMERVRGVAEQVVMERVERIRNHVISELAKELPETIEKGADPDFQYALLDAEKAYARRGDDEMAALLVDMLMERTRKDEQSLQHIVLGEALIAAPKLPKSLYDVLSLIFFLKYTGNDAPTPQHVIEHYRRNLVPLLGVWPPSMASLQHLEYAGCASIELITGYDPAEVMVKAYPNAFPNAAAPNGFDLRAELAKASPKIEEMLSTWQSSAVKSVSLTSVGIAIGALNLSRRLSVPIDLGIWIN